MEEEKEGAWQDKKLCSYSKTGRFPVMTEPTQNSIQSALTGHMFLVMGITGKNPLFHYEQWGTPASTFGLPYSIVTSIWNLWATSSCVCLHIKY